MPDQTPIAIVVQCHRCLKHLKYAGKKPVITCPGCGESVPVVRNIQEGESIVLPPPIQAVCFDQASRESIALTLPEKFRKSEKEDPSIQSSNTTREGGETINDWLKKYNPKTAEAVRKVKEMPRFPVVLTGIWIVWLLCSLLVFLYIINVGKRFGDSAVLIGGDVISNAKWTSMCVEFIVYFGMTTGFIAIVLSTIAYFWVGALEAKHS